MLNLRNLSIIRGDGEQQFTVSLPELYLQDGEIAAITGASGCGKSTLLEVIGLILQPNILDLYQLGDKSNIINLVEMIDKKEELALSRIRAEKLGFMLQHGGLLPFLTILQNIMLPCESLDVKVDMDWFNFLCNSLTVSHLLSKFPNQLSIGERQRIAFIRAVIHKPSLLLADEPTSALDPYHAEKLLDLIVSLANNQNISVLLVTHDWEQVRKKGFRVFKAELDLDNRKSLFIEDTLR